MSTAELTDLLTSILDAIPHAVLVLKRRRIVFANPAVREVFGWHPDELVGRDTRLLYRNEEDYAEIGRRFYTALERERTHVEPFPCRRKDGKDIFCMVSTSRTGATLRDKMIVATYEDITERKALEDAIQQTCRTLEMRVQDQSLELLQVLEALSTNIGERIRAEDSLRESKQLLSDIISFLPDPTLVIDREGKVLIWNRAIEEMTGVRAENMVGRGEYEYALPFYGERRPILIDLVFVPREDLERKYSFIRKEKNLLIAETDVPFVKGQKRILWGKAGLIYNVRGEIVGAIESIRDVTDRKLMEESVKQSEQNLRKILDGMPIAVVVSRMSDDRILYLNPRAAGTFGLTGEEASRRKATDFYDDPAERISLVADLRAVGSVANEERVLRGAGGTFTALLSATAIPYAGEEAVLASYVDITEHKKLESRLAQAAKMEAIGTLAGGIAHDFNNLLMGIQGYISLMLMDLPPDHPHVRKLKRIEEQVTSGAGLTGQILGFARGGQYEMKPTDLNALLKRTSELFSRTRKDITIHGCYDPSLWTVVVDRAQVEQALLDLYLNSGQAMPEGGDLYLESVNAPIREEDVMEAPVTPGRYVRISVTDTGTGMDEKTRQRIFEPFFTTKGMGKGAGLGLASVYGIVKAHDGYIFVSSRSNEGARFDLYFPAFLTAPAEAGPERDGFVRGKETILLVDDEEVVVDVTRELLEMMGYRVLVAGSGREGVELYRKRGDRIDLVVLDMIMPGMGGSEVFDQIRAMNPSARILLSSGFSLSDQAQEIMDKGCNGFIQKPFQPGELSLKIRQVLDG